MNSLFIHIDIIRTLPLAIAVSSSPLIPVVADEPTPSQSRQPEILDLEERHG